MEYSEKDYILFRRKCHLKDITGEREISQYLYRLAGNHDAEGYIERNKIILRAALLELSNHSFNLFYDFPALH